MFYVLCFMFYVLCFMFYVLFLCFMFYVLCFMFYVLCFMFCVLCFMFYVLCFMFVCSCLFAGLTATRINLKFGMHTLIGFECAIGYIILTFEVIKGHFRSNKFIFKVPWCIACSFPFHTLVHCILIFM